MGHKPSQNRRAFSILEVVVVLLIVGIGLALVGVSLRGSIDQEGPRGLALTIASELRAARAEAQRSGKMVALGFPSNNKTNSVSRAVILRNGEQKGHLKRVKDYDSDYEASIFVGSWPGAVETDADLSSSWQASVSNELALHFQPDGSCRSDDIRSVDGSYPVVVASGFQGNFSGPTGTLTHAKNPYTIWVSQSGSVRVEQGLPVGTLPAGEGPLTVAQPSTLNLAADNAPTLAHVRFFPEAINPSEGAYVGQNYVSIHPNQKDGSGGYLEYGFASIEIFAEDIDGGPLTYTLEAEDMTTGGDHGNFTVKGTGSVRRGQLRYDFVEGVDLDGDAITDPGKYYWRAQIAWRPPPGTPEDHVFQLTVTVEDEKGNSFEVSSANGLLPSVKSLPPSRIVMCTADKELFITNLDGANEVCITHDGVEEVGPFFSSDGSRVLSFHDSSDAPPFTRELRSRPADGSRDYEVISDFEVNTGTTVVYDPTYTYAALVNTGGVEVFPWGRVDGTGGESDDPKLTVGGTKVAFDHIEIVNLAGKTSNNLVGQVRAGSFHWGSPKNRHSFGYTHTKPTPLKNLSHGFGFHHVQPGQESDGRARRLVGYPPSLQPASSIGNARNHYHNPANPNWYLRVDPSDAKKLYLGNYNLGSEQLVTSEVQHNDADSLYPRWSADGKNITFVQNPGSGATVKVVPVLDAAFTQVNPSFTPSFARAIPNASGSQTSPEAEWVYFMRDGDVFRTSTASPGSLVNISEHINKSMLGYVISP